MSRGSLWNQCIDQLERELPEKQLNTWIRPLQALEDNSAVRLLAPNSFVMDWVRSNFHERITALARTLSQNPDFNVVLEIGSSPDTGKRVTAVTRPVRDGNVSTHKRAGNYFESHLTRSFTFDNFVEGKCNQLARAAAFQVSEHPGRAYNPLLIYGGVGLGKTHLMQAVGNRILSEDQDKRVVYLRSERFVADMVKALQHNTINDFKRFYRSVDVLLIDDIQFFANKERSQEEFFHTFNELLESKQQIILTCDKYPKEVDGLQARLQSRFGWGLTQAIESPELETRVAIMQRKAEDAKIDLPSDTAFFIAKRIRSNIRELEGALNRVIANANFIGSRITLEFAREALRDLIAVHDRVVTIENIQKTVAEFYKIRVADLHSKRRSRSITRPRQLCMALAKELTNHSLPEIGDAFGGRDHTTVLHACRKVKELRETDSRLDEDYNTLLRILAS